MAKSRSEYKANKTGMSTVVNSAEEACEGTKTHSLIRSLTGISAIGAQYERMRESAVIFRNQRSAFQTACRDRIATQGRTNLPPATASATRISAIDKGWGRMAEFQRNFTQASHPDGKNSPDGTRIVSVLPSDLIISTLHAAADGRTELARICRRSSAPVAEPRNSRIVFADVNQNIKRSLSPLPGAESPVTNQTCKFRPGLTLVVTV